ncbi:acetylserotonin methytransferase-like protein (ASMTL), putative [Talaromyces stipitatus ATCC 10500]|uniref:Acetylserotonin methytransferase-like protein (ASMTL), putative n=1 Tax=Talaromyces stipitatus (strain ATCC 10500 / CBS 375.48 / QM 6759 / NRRL 1006) TaxID=441959 RepID=B8M1W9_TALSN|nr:acetylserotonin methytransferase-like protein (ASMTL), putative [Talaromyces stipitatus ATCC 10500]EED21347.1 acetylserotonin methytransferase-like protein (ASMTL), putative [Talaromyces stipitatus ATCC 10500]
MSDGFPFDTPQHPAISNLDIIMSEKGPLGSIPPDPPTYEDATATSTTTTMTTTTTARPPQPRPPFPLSLPILHQLRTKRVILASQSPRRKQIMSFLGFPNLEIIPCTEPEDFPKTMGPIDYVLATATKKAQTIYRQEVDNAEKGEPGLILAADTIVVDSAHGDMILEKPRSEAHHVAMLKSLRDGRNHVVYTAIVAMVPLASARMPGYAIESHVEETSVQFDPDVTDDLIVAYVKTREGADKAGGYGLQGLGSILVNKIEGSYDNVIGLPLKATLQLIQKTVMKADDDELLPEEDGLDEDEFEG